MIWYQKRKGKYNAKSTIYNGVAYHSKKEAAYAKELDLRQKAGEIKKWERQVKISLDVYGSHICNYYIDFVVHYPNGKKEYVEIKGFETLVWRLKWKLFEAIWNKKYPNDELVVIK